MEHTDTAVQPITENPSIAKAVQQYIILPPTGISGMETYYLQQTFTALRVQQILLPHRAGS